MITRVCWSGRIASVRFHDLYPPHRAGRPRDLGVAVTAALAITGQLGPDPQLSKVSLTVSDFAVSDKGGVTDWAMLTFAGAALALLPALRRPTPAVVASLSLFAGGMLTAAIFHTDAGTQLTPTGYVHRYSSIAAFIALPVAVCCRSARSHVRQCPWRRDPGFHQPERNSRVVIEKLHRSIEAQPVG